MKKALTTHPLPFVLLLICIQLLMPAQLLSQGDTKDYVTRKTVKGKAKKSYEEGMKNNVAGKNEKAIKLFEKAIKQEPRLIDAHIQRAALYYHLKNYTEAEKGFEDVMEIDPNYNSKVMYTLAASEMRLGKLDEATTHFQQYIDSKPKNKNLLRKADRYVKRIGFTQYALANPVPFEPKSLGDQINTDFSEYLPTLTADEEVLVYTARIRGDENFFISKKIDGVWQKGQPIEDINTRQNEGAQSISADGRFLVFTACNREDGYGSCDIYYSEKRDNRWTPPENIGAPINSPRWESQPSISWNGNAIYFTSNRKGGPGQKDIYVSYRKSDGTWGKPVNLGDVINTPDDEQSPFIHPDGQTLYFMSNGHPGLGANDLFFSKRQEDGKWGKPTNLGYPINTVADEGAIAISLDGKTAYFATDRENPSGEGQSSFENGSKGNTDLYSFELYEAARPNPVTYVQAQVYDAETKKPLVASVEFFDLANGAIHTSSETYPDGSFLVVLPAGKNYALNVNRTKYLFHSENFALTEGSSIDDPFLLEIYLQPIPENTSAATETEYPEAKPIILKNVFFDTGSAELRPESFTELDRLATLLTDNAVLQIELRGHTDNVGSEEDNLTLSNGRAKSVYEYLIQKGISSTRLRYQGFGETLPIDTNETPIGRQNNRRTEFLIVRG